MSRFMKRPERDEGSAAMKTSRVVSRKPDSYHFIFYRSARACSFYPTYLLGTQWNRTGTFGLDMGHRTLDSGLGAHPGFKPTSITLLR